MGGRRGRPSVPDARDNPGTSPGVEKVEVLGEALVLRQGAAQASHLHRLATLPYFYALSENYGEPEKDYLVQYEEGRLTWEAKTLYETMRNEGPPDTVSLRNSRI